MSAVDFAVEIAQDEPRHRTTGDADAWMVAIKGLTRSQCWAVLDSFGPSAKNISPADFGKAKHRLYPPEKHEPCDDTGQLWDGEKYTFCTCPKGEHMAELNARLLAESTALRPVWAAALPEQARRYDGNVVTLERLCGQCGSPRNEHTETDRKFCDTLSPKGGKS